MPVLCCTLLSETVQEYHHECRVKLEQGFHFPCTITGLYCSITYIIFLFRNVCVSLQVNFWQEKHIVYLFITIQNVINDWEGM